MRPHHVKLACLGLACLAAACAESGESPGTNAGSSATSGAGGETAADSGTTGASGTGRAGRGGEPAGAGAASGGSPGAAGSGESGSGESGGGASGPTTGEAGTTEPDDAGAAGCSLSCDPGQHCELVQVTCVRAPCPPIPMCVEDPRPAATNDCDPKKILCRRATPVCPEGELPSVSGSCYGACVPAESCACKQADECPNVEAYTCHLSAKHCGPYVN